MPLPGLPDAPGGVGSPHEVMSEHECPSSHFSEQKLPCRACGEDHSPLLRCEVASRQRMANAAWITPVESKNLDNSRTYRYRDREKRRAQMREVMRRRRARLRALKLGA